MAAAKRVIVAGAAGVFGSLLVSELRRRAWDVIPATRRELDLADFEAVRRAAAGAFALCCTAGPFQRLDRRAVAATIDAGAHWLDIADDPSWFFGLIDDRDLDARARANGVAVAPGLSTMPAISTALVRTLAMESGASSAHVVLRIGNRNRKGAASIASALAARGAIVTPDRELLRRETGIGVTTAVEFESRIGTAIMRALSNLPLSPDAAMRLARLLTRVSPLLSFYGTDEAAIVATAGSRTATLRGVQRMAILPLVAALGKLENGSWSGCLTPSQIVPDRELLAFVEEAR